MGARVDMAGQQIVSDECTCPPSVMIAAAPRGNLPLLRLLESERQLRGSLYPGGWVGPKTLFAHPETEPLQAFIRSCLPEGKWELQGWGVVLEAGQRLERHDHQFPGNVWSGVYYLQGTGAIEFDDGSYEPEESSLIVFPAAAPHSVVATTRRLSIAFNARGGHG